MNRRLFSSRSVVIGLVLFVLMTALLLGSNLYAQRTNTPPFLQRFGNDLASGISRVLSYPTNAVGQTANSVGHLLNTFEENQKLRAKVDELAQDKVRLSELEAENAALKKDLNLKATLTDYETVSAVVISRSPTSWDSQLVIDQGSNSGLKKGMPVLAGEGMVGRISEVNTNNAKVALISDTSESADRFAIAIKSGKGDINGVVTDFDRQANQLVMGQVTSDSGIKKGDVVQTSGLGGVIPKGLYVGKVSRIATDDYGLSKRVYIEPSADLGNIPTVTVAISQVGGE
jgi:rod shape-determining protein MreC